MNHFRSLPGPIAAFALAFAALPALATVAPAESAIRTPSAELKDRYAQVRERLEKSPYGRPLLLDSRRGDVERRGGERVGARRRRGRRLRGARDAFVRRPQVVSGLRSFC